MKIIVDENITLQSEKEMEECSGLFGFVAFLAEGKDENLLDLFNYFDGKVLAHSVWDGFYSARSKDGEVVPTPIIDGQKFVINFM